MLFPQNSYRIVAIDSVTSLSGADAPAASSAPGMQRKKSRMSVMFNEMHDVPHDDEVGVETSWHDLHGGSFHRLSKKHKAHVHRRLSSMGPVAEKPTDISTYAHVCTVRHPGPKKTLKFRSTCMYRRTEKSQFY